MPVPGLDAAGHIDDVIEPLAGKHLRGDTASPADGAVYQGGLGRIDLAEMLVQFGNWDQSGAWNMPGFVFPGLADIDQVEAILGALRHKGPVHLRLHRFCRREELFPAQGYLPKIEAILPGAYQAYAAPFRII